MANLVTDSVSGQLREIVAATRSGQTLHARELIRGLREREPNNEQVLLWAAALAENPDEAHAHLERVLAINPRNQQALNTLAMARLNPAPARKPEADAHSALVKPASSAAPTPSARPAPVPPPPEFHKIPATAPPPAQPKAPAQCLICDTLLVPGLRKCRACGCLVEIADVTALAEHRGVNEKLVLDVIDRWQQRVRQEPSFEAYHRLGRAYLNINRSAEALPCLRKALEMRPGEFALADAIRALEARGLVLAVDDSQTLRRVLAIMLERKGYRVLTANDGMQALARLNDVMPDLILLDITMPRMDGYQVCKVIKQNPYTKHIPVIMLSGNDGFFDKVKGRLAGSADYVTKPFEEQALLRTVEKYSPRRTGSEQMTGRKR